MAPRFAAHAHCALAVAFGDSALLKVARTLQTSPGQQCRGERLHDRLRLIPAPQVAAHAETRMGRQLVILHGLRAQRTERSRDAFDGVQAQALLPADRDELSAMGARDAGEWPITQGGQNFVVNLVRVSALSL